jgi:hypothetical protein
VYQDPLEVIWIHAAAQMGIRVERSAEVFAAWDGNGTLRIGTPETLDADDSLAQLIFHEICHALCEWPAALGKPDWGLSTDDSTDVVREHACLRLQAALADLYGLRRFLAATTDHRAYYDELPSKPLQEDGDPAVSVARRARQRAETGPWAEPLHTALQLTADLARLIQNHTTPTSLWRLD